MQIAFIVSSCCSPFINIWPVFRQEILVPSPHPPGKTEQPRPNSPMWEDTVGSTPSHSAIGGNGTD